MNSALYLYARPHTSNEIWTLVVASIYLYSILDGKILAW